MILLDSIFSESFFTASFEIAKFVSQKQIRFVCANLFISFLESIDRGGLVPLELLQSHEQQRRRIAPMIE